ncbi:MAG: DUF1579 domain-containing protein [Gemmatimonadales bacterium]|nr:DUF1579 domain-containing protein [Gemmatimonadales bacterium]
MSKFSALLTAIAAVGLLVIPAGAEAQEKEGMAAADAAYMAAAAPGPQHAAMAAIAGSYRADVKTWMDPTADPIVSTGKTEFKMILGGRYLVQHYAGSMMGQEFEGMGITAYDNLDKQYVSTWVDNMGTGIMVTKGNYDESGKILTTVGEVIDPATGVPLTVKSVSTTISEDVHRFEMYMVVGGQEVKTLEATYTRTM